MESKKQPPASKELFQHTLTELVRLQQSTLADLVRIEDYDPNAMSVESALKWMHPFLNPVSEIEAVPLKSALGRVLAGALRAPQNVPNYDNSAMDGFAFRFSEANAPLDVVGTAFAGKPFVGEISAHQCVKVMTGAMLPARADTVVMQEHTQMEGDRVRLQQLPPLGANIRRAGEDLQAGQTVLEQGHWLQAADIGLLASLGIAQAQVFRRLKVAFFSTGDELARLGEPLNVGQVYDSNRYSLFAMLSRLGLECLDLGAVPDDISALENTLLQAAHSADVVITSGGVSVGEADYMKALLQKHGQVLFWKINMKPGRPLAYGKIGNAHYFGLPGNPVAVMVTFYQFVRNALLRLSGTQASPPLTLQLICTSPIKKARGRKEFQRGVMLEQQGVWQVKPTGAQGSAMLSSMSHANCFIVLDEAVGDLPAGSVVTVQPFAGLI